MAKGCNTTAEGRDAMARRDCGHDEDHCIISDFSYCYIHIYIYMNVGLEGCC